MELSLLSAEEVAEVLGARVRVERLAQGLTQRTLAERAGVSVATVKRLERDGSGTVSSLLAVVTALGRAMDLQGVMAPRPVATLDEALSAAPARQRGWR